MRAKPSTYITSKVYNSVAWYYKYNMVQATKYGHFFNETTF